MLSPSLIPQSQSHFIQKRSLSETPSANKLTGSSLYYIILSSPLSLSLSGGALPHSLLFTGTIKIATLCFDSLIGEGVIRVWSG